MLSALVAKDLQVNTLVTKLTAANVVGSASSGCGDGKKRNNA